MVSKLKMLLPRLESANKNDIVSQITFFPKAFCAAHEDGCLNPNKVHFPTMQKIYDRNIALALKKFI